MTHKKRTQFFFRQHDVLGGIFPYPRWDILPILAGTFPILAGKQLEFSSARRPRWVFSLSSLNNFVQ